MSCLRPCIIVLVVVSVVGSPDPFTSSSHLDPAQEEEGILLLPSTYQKSLTCHHPGPFLEGDIKDGRM